MRILYANYFAWGHRKAFDTDGLVAGTKFQNFYLSLDSLNTVPSTFTEIGTVMPTDGKFIGMIIHVGANDGDGVSKYEIYRRTFTSNYADESVIGTVSIPAGESGCFYSDPDAPLPYFQYDNLYLTGWKETGATNKGTSDVTVLLGMESESNDLKDPGDYTSLQNF